MDLRLKHESIYKHGESLQKLFNTYFEWWKWKGLMWNYYILLNIFALFHLYNKNIIFFKIKILIENTLKDKKIKPLEEQEENTGEYLYTPGEKKQVQGWGETF